MTKDLIPGLIDVIRHVKGLPDRVMSAHRGRD